MAERLHHCVLPLEDEEYSYENIEMLRFLCIEVAKLNDKHSPPDVNACDKDGHNAMFYARRQRSLTLYNEFVALGYSSDADHPAASALFDKQVKSFETKIAAGAQMFLVRVGRCTSSI